MAKKFKYYEIKGEAFGVRFEPRGDGDDHICIQLLTEDDGHWHEDGASFSSYWIKDLIKVLKRAQSEMKQNNKKDDGCGYKF